MKSIHIPFRSRYKTLRGLVASLLLATVFLIAVLSLFGRTLRPDLEAAHEAPDPETLAAIAQNRDTSFDSENLPLLHQAVDVSEGPAARWYPKGESPILAEHSQHVSLSEGNSLGLRRISKPFDSLTPPFNHLTASVSFLLRDFFFFETIQFQRHILCLHKQTTLHPKVHTT